MPGRSSTSSREQHVARSPGRKAAGSPGQSKASGQKAAPKGRGAARSHAAQSRAPRKHHRRPFARRQWSYLLAALGGAGLGLISQDQASVTLSAAWSAALCWHLSRHLSRADAAHEQTTTGEASDDPPSAEFWRAVRFTTASLLFLGACLLLTMATVAALRAAGAPVDLVPITLALHPLSPGAPISAAALAPAWWLTLRSVWSGIPERSESAAAAGWLGLMWAIGSR